MEDPWPGAFLQVTVRTRMHPHACLGWMKHLLLWEESKRFMETARLAKGPAGGVDPKALYSRGPLKFKADFTSIIPPDPHHGQ